MIGLIWTYCALNDFSRWAIQMMEASSDPSTSPASPLETRMREPPLPPPCLSVTLTQESRGSTLVLSLRTTTLSWCGTDATVHAMFWLIPKAPCRCPTSATQPMVLPTWGRPPPCWSSFLTWAWWTRSYGHLILICYVLSFHKCSFLCYKTMLPIVLCWYFPTCVLINGSEVVRSHWITTYTIVSAVTGYNCLYDTCTIIHELSTLGTK